MRLLLTLTFTFSLTSRRSLKMWDRSMLMHLVTSSDTQMLSSLMNTLIFRTMWTLKTCHKTNWWKFTGTIVLWLICISRKSDQGRLMKLVMYPHIWIRWHLHLTINCMSITCSLSIITGGGSQLDHSWKLSLNSRSSSEIDLLRIIMIMIRGRSMMSNGLKIKSFLM
jgi:hypothetical protein